MTCTCCNTPLTGGPDTFGDVGQEMCQSCWWALLYDNRDAMIQHAEYVESLWRHIAEMERMEQSS